MLIRHYVRVTAALAATGPGPQTSSIYPAPPAGAAEPGALVVIASSDAASAAAAATAARLWNAYYPQSSLSPATVTTNVVDDFGGANTVGLASGVQCPPSDPRHLCSPVTLQVKRGWETLFVDIFVHEIGHAVVFRDATAPGRAVDGSHHWSPFEPSELFGPYIAAEPWLAAYTVAAAGAGETCAADADCAGVCAAVPGFQRVPRVCAPAVPAPPAPAAPSPSPAAGSGSSGSTAAAVGGGVAGAVVLGLALAALTRRGAAPDPARESFI